MICTNDIHNENAPHLIVVTEEGIITCVNDEHLLKAQFPIDVINDGISICSNFWHPSKLFSLISFPRLYNKSFIIS